MTDGHKQPSTDARQNWNVTNLTEANGMVIMAFNRKQDTTDTEGDNVIGVSTHVCLQRKTSIYCDSFYICIHQTKFIKLYQMIYPKIIFIEIIDFAKQKSGATPWKHGSDNYCCQQNCTAHNN